MQMNHVRRFTRKQLAEARRSIDISLAIQVCDVVDDAAGESLDANIAARVACGFAAGSTHDVVYALLRKLPDQMLDIDLRPSHRIRMEREGHVDDLHP